MKETEQDRLAKPRHPLPTLRKGTAVSIFMGAGWEKGTVTDSTRDRCTVRLGRGAGRSRTCFDARNIKQI